MGSLRVEPFPAGPGASLLPAALLLAAALLVGEAAAQSSAARTIYCCDVGGQPVCGDILPAACYGRAYRELSPSGIVRRTVPAPLTADEVTRRAELERQRRADEAERQRQQRLDQALLETYRSLDDLDRRRDRELRDVDRTLHELRAREAALLEHQRVLIRDATQTDKSDVAASLERDIRTLDSEIIAQRGVIEAKAKERAAVFERFAEDRRRYLELTAE